MEQWEFYTQRQSGADYTRWMWRWRVRVMESGEIVKQSTASFATLPQCLADARSNGYTGDGPSAAGSVKGVQFRRESHS